MSKGGRLTKLKSVIKRWHSMSSSNSRLSPANVTSIVAANPSDDVDDRSVLSPEKITPEGGLRPVYVGKSRRRYLVSSDLIDHPLFQELVDRSSAESDSIRVGCEVVLFEHLLWMLQNADPQPESLEELVEFYAC